MRFWASFRKQLRDGQLEPIQTEAFHDRIGQGESCNFLFTYPRPFQALFETEAIPVWVWPWLLLEGLAFFLVVEAEKLIIRTKRSARATP